MVLVTVAAELLAQGFAGCQGTAAVGLLAQGTKGSGVECGMACWPTPPLFK